MLLPARSLVASATGAPKAPAIVARPVPFLQEYRFSSSQSIPAAQPGTRLNAPAAPISSTFFLSDRGRTCAQPFACVSTQGRACCAAREGAQR